LSDPGVNQPPNHPADHSSDDPGIDASLLAGCAELGLSPSPKQIASLVSYTDEVLRWGKHINLTGVRDAADFASDHVLDSLAPFSHLNLEAGSRWADVGSGAGVPGIPLAILAPDSHWTLLEPRQKRWAFLVHVIHHLGLTNVAVQCKRIEDGNIAPASLDGVVSRALGAPTLLAHSWLKPGGVIGLYAGSDLERWENQVGNLPLSAEPPITLLAPGREVQRRLVCYRKTPAA